MIFEDTKTKYQNLQWFSLAPKGALRRQKTLRVSLPLRTTYSGSRQSKNEVLRLPLPLAPKRGSSSSAQPTVSLPLRTAYSGSRQSKNFVLRLPLPLAPKGARGTSVPKQ